MKKWENPNLINLSVKNTTNPNKPIDPSACNVCFKVPTPGLPDVSNHKGWCTVLGGSGVPSPS